MAADIVLDSSALLAFLFGEQSAGEVEAILTRALEEKHQVLVSAINWAEVLCRVIEVRGTEGLSIVRHVERTSPIQIVSVDAELAEMAGVFSTQYSAPLADAFAAALAKHRKATLVTVDSDFKVLAREVQIQWLRHRQEERPASQTPAPAPAAVQPVPPERKEIVPQAPAPRVDPAPPAVGVNRGQNDRQRERNAQRRDRTGKPSHHPRSPQTQGRQNYSPTSTGRGGDRKNNQQSHPRHHRQNSGGKRQPYQPRQNPTALTTPRRRVRPEGWSVPQHFQHTRPRPTDHNVTPPPPKEKPRKPRGPRGKASK